MERIGESELAVMKVLWDPAPLTVAEVAAGIDPARDWSDRAGKFGAETKTGYWNLKRLCSLLCGGLVVASSTVGWAQSPEASSARAAIPAEDTRVSEVTVVGKRMPPAEAPLSRTCEAYVQSDPAFRTQLDRAIAADDPLMGPRIYQPTRMPRNPDYSAAPSVAPGTPIIPAKPFWDLKNMAESDGFESGGEVASLGADLADDEGASGSGELQSALSVAITGCRILYTRGYNPKRLPSMIRPIPGPPGDIIARSRIAGSDTVLPTAFALFDQGRYQESLSYFQRARSKLKDEEGGVEAGLMIGKLHLFAPIVGADPAQALKWLDRTAMSAFDPVLHMPTFDPKEPERNTAIGEAAVILGRVYLTGARNAPKNPATALKWFKRANTVGHVAAAKMVGDLYYQGRGAPRDLKQAASYYKQAATLDYAPAQYALAEMLYRGDLGAPDIKGALAWYNAAAKYKHPGALYALALAYEAGEGVAADSRKALTYYKEAALSGNVAAQSALGTYFYSGEHVPQDYSTARTWFEAAAVRGDPDAMFNLAVMLMKGEGGDVDRPKAWVWFRVAQKKGLPKARVALASLEKLMTTDERATAGELLAPKKKS